MDIGFLAPAPRKQLCTKSYSSWTAELSFLVKGIQQYYLNQWVADNLPVTLCEIRDDQNEGGKTHCIKNFPIGCYHESDTMGEFPFVFYK